MKVLFDARPMISNYAGVGYYINRLLSNMHHNNLRIYALAYDIASYESLEKTSTLEVIKLPYSFKKLVSFVLDIAKLPLFNGYDIIHQTHFGILPSRSKQTKIVTTIHDLAFMDYPEYFVKNNLFVSRIALAEQIKKSDKIITVSNVVKRQLVERFSILDSKIVVVHNGCDAPFYDYSKKEESSVLAAFGINTKYFLYLGTIEPRKNILSLLKAFSRIYKDHDVVLVIAGKKGWKYESILRYVKENELAGVVRFTGYVNQTQKQVLMKNAQLFVFPSLYEGFGLPVLEAMSYGVPVITTKGTSMEEITGDCAILVDPYSIDDICKSMLDVVSGKYTGADLAEKAVRQAKKFSWEATAENTLNVYKQLLGG